MKSLEFTCYYIGNFPIGIYRQTTLSPPTHHPTPPDPTLPTSYSDCVGRRLFLLRLDSCFRGFSLDFSLGGGAVLLGEIGKRFSFGGFHCSFMRFAGVFVTVFKLRPSCRGDAFTLQRRDPALIDIMGSV